MISRSVAEVLDHHVSLDLEGIDRLYLNAYVPLLQRPGGVTHFFRLRQGAGIASPVLMAPMTRAFVGSIKRFARRQGLDLVRFRAGERKDEVTQARLRSFEGHEGVVYIGVAQERFSAFRMGGKAGGPGKGLYRSTVMCNQYYFYLLDDDFGPLFIKFSSYFPYTARVCLNGHEYAKRQLDKAGVGYEALDNGFLSCEAPEKLQQVLDQLSAAPIEALVRKWLARLPHPFSAQDRAAGFRYELSVLQAEFARTQVFDRPLSGRHFFEEIIRENLDLGRPAQVSLIFARRVTKRTPGRFRTRIITEGVIPSLHVSYKCSKIKQYFKEGRALRTETTINNTRDFAIGRRLSNLPALRAIGFRANRRLLEVERLSHDCAIGEQTFEQLTQPQQVDGQRAPALKFGEHRVMALFQALCLFITQPEGFSNATLREHVAHLMGQPPQAYKPGRMTYDLRRLRLHGVIERIAHTHRYRVTALGQRICLFLCKVYARVLRPGLSQLTDGLGASSSRALASAMQRLDHAIEHLIGQAKLTVEF